MRFNVDTTSAVPIYAQLIEQVKHALAAGTLQQGDALPSLREVSTRLRISPLTVKKAYGELETLGITFTEHGRGTFISADFTPYSEQYRQQALVSLSRNLLIEAFRLGASLEEIHRLLDEQASTINSLK